MPKPSERIRNLMGVYSRRALELEQQAKQDLLVAEQMRMHISTLQDIATAFEQEEEKGGS